MFLSIRGRSSENTWYKRTCEHGAPTPCVLCTGPCPPEFHSLDRKTGVQVGVAVQEGTGQGLSDSGGNLYSPVSTPQWTSRASWMEGGREGGLGDCGWANQIMRQRKKGERAGKRDIQNKNQNSRTKLRRSWKWRDG